MPWLSQTYSGTSWLKKEIIKARLIINVPVWLRHACLCLYRLDGYSSFGCCGICTKHLKSNKIFWFLSFQECLEFFNIPETQSSHYFLMDKRWNLIHYNKVKGKDWVHVTLFLWLFILNKQPINRALSCGHHFFSYMWWKIGIWEKREEAEEESLALKSRMSSFLRKDQISLLFVLFHNTWHCLKAPALQKGLRAFYSILLSDAIVITFI